MSYQLNPLLDAIEVSYGPKIEIGKNLLLIAESARNLGIQWYLGRGFERLLEVNQSHGDSWSPLAPPFDPDVSDINEDNALYVEGQSRGEPVVTLAIRRYDWPNSSLKTEWETGRFAYRDPASQMQADETWVAQSPMAANISGRVSFAGGMWFRPDFRGRRLPILTVALVRSLSLTVWDPDYAIAMLETGVTSRALLPLYGNPPAQTGMQVIGGWKTFDSTVIWETREALTARIVKQSNKTSTAANHTDQWYGGDETVTRTATPR